MKDYTLTPEVAARFWSKVDRGGDCWEWAGRKPDGYGRFAIDSWPFLAHRIAYELAIGDIPPGLVLDHLCRNPACVRPEHLEPVTQAENVRRGLSCFELTGKCRAGLHDTDSNSVYVAKNGDRRCLHCKRDENRRAAARYRARMTDEQIEHVRVRARESMRLLRARRKSQMKEESK